MLPAVLLGAVFVVVGADSLLSSCDTAVAWHGTLEGGDLVLASGSDDTTIGLWRLERGPGGSVQVKSISVVKHHDGVGVHHLAWAPGKDWLASVGGTGKITVLEGAAKAAQGDATDSTPVVATFNAGAGGLDAMSWNPDGTKIAVALPDNSVRVWTLGDSGRGARCLLCASFSCLFEADCINH